MFPARRRKCGRSYAKLSHFRRFYTETASDTLQLALSYDVDSTVPLPVVPTRNNSLEESCKQGNSSHG
jgi:hypothetical protein